MRSDRYGTWLALLAALTGAPASGASHRPDIVWLAVCDATHPGRRIPLPLRRDREAPPPGCHAACALMPERRVRR